MIMKCIIVDDEPIAREGMESLVARMPELELLKSFCNAEEASAFIREVTVDLIFLDINMPGISGIEFAHTVPRHTLIIFTTGYSQYASDSYEVDAIDYLVKPIESSKFRKAVDKASTYHKLLINEEKNTTDNLDDGIIFIKSGRRYIKVNLDDILFVEGLKDYIVVQTEDQQIITRMTLKAISELLPGSAFYRINKSYIINKSKIDSFDNNDVQIGTFEITIGNAYREEFFKNYTHNKTLK